MSDADRNEGRTRDAIAEVKRYLALELAIRQRYKATLADEVVLLCPPGDPDEGVTVGAVRLFLRAGDTVTGPEVVCTHNDTPTAARVALLVCEMARRHGIDLPTLGEVVDECDRRLSTDSVAQALEMKHQRDEWRVEALQLQEAARAALPVLLEDRELMYDSHRNRDGKVDDPLAVAGLAQYDDVIAALRTATGQPSETIEG